MGKNFWQENREDETQCSMQVYRDTAKKSAPINLERHAYSVVKFMLQIRLHGLSEYGLKVLEEEFVLLE